MGKRRTYSSELKVQAVKEYLKGETSYNQVAQSFGISNRSLLREWVGLYHRFGWKGLDKKSTGYTYSREFKLSVIHYKQIHSLTNQAVANHFKLPSESVISVWQNKYLAEGMEGLALKIKERAMDDMKSKDNHPNDNALSEAEREELKRLRRENELLRIENLYRKKLASRTRKKKK